MELQAGLRVLAAHRGDALVITTMAAEREWLTLSRSERDFFYVPSSMGQAPMLGLGLALARPDLRVVVVNGDGCMLMNLGCLVTIADAAPRNYWLLVVDNGVYEVTGGQPVPGAGRIDWMNLAAACGIVRVYQFDTLTSWQQGAPIFLSGPGPAFAVLKVEVGSCAPPVPLCPMPEQVRRLRRLLSRVTPPSTHSLANSRSEPESLRSSD
jgi:sulfopyruvate decarboxylase subunit beta